MLTKDELFRIGDKERIWRKYCGFLDLSITEFMDMQEQLLMNQIELVYDSPLARKFMPKKPKDIAEFRSFVPVTTFDDYAAYLDSEHEDVLATKPYLWARTSGKGGTPKQVPYTERAMERLAMSSIASLILACATRKGEVNIGSGTKILHCMPPPPYLSGIITRTVPQLLDARVIPPLDRYQDTEFEARIRDGFRIALRTRVDILSSLTTVLVKMGKVFAESSGHMKLSRHMLHPQVALRLIGAWLRAKRQGRTLLPKDLWPLKGLACYGTDTSIYREQLIHYWGREPLELYGATEAGIMATNAWNKKSMTFFPFVCFLEFAPEEEWVKSRENKDYQPSTVLLSELRPGERYEVILTSFYGMPFLRYRLGDLIKIVALEDEEAGINLPQMVFDGRADDIIDISGFPRLDEKTIWQAIASSGIEYEDWVARKEYEGNQPIVRLYIESKEQLDVSEVERMIEQQLVAINPDYADLVSMLGSGPLKVTLLPFGSFQRYYEERQRDGAELAHLKPPHMNASDTIIQDLVGSRASST